MLIVCDWLRLGSCFQEAPIFNWPWTHDFAKKESDARRWDLCGKGREANAERDSLTTEHKIEHRVQSLLWTRWKMGYTRMWAHVLLVMCWKFRYTTEMSTLQSSYHWIHYLLSLCRMNDRAKLRGRNVSILSGKDSQVSGNTAPEFESSQYFSSLVYKQGWRDAFHWYFHHHWANKVSGWAGFICWGEIVILWLLEEFHLDWKERKRKLRLNLSAESIEHRPRTILSWFDLYGDDTIFLTFSISKNRGMEINAN